jgi:hypothetical protein
MSSNPPPTYTINLSLPPRSRYRAVATEYAPVLHQLTPLYSEVVSYIKLPPLFFHYLGRLLLHRLYSDEQTEELHGISEASHVPMYLLIAYNVILDLLMGCTSGGVRVRHGVRIDGDNEEDEEGGDGGPTMMHFRTLDWMMPALRDAVVQFEYIESPNGPVVARTLGYVGFVGVLTGVRKGLSVSLNFRPHHNATSVSIANLKYYWNTLLVLLGRRPSISTVLRDFLLPRPASQTPRVHRKLSKRRGCDGREKHDDEVEEEEKKLLSTSLPPYTSDTISSLLPTMRTPVAYLIFCTPSETLILEKDFCTANILRSDEFISTTNHDVACEYSSTTAAAGTAASSTPPDSTPQSKTRMHAFLQISMQEILDESIDRKRCLTSKWKAWSQRQAQQAKRGQPAAKGVTLTTLRKWIETYPVCNEVTHFACIMDPREGVFRWVRKFEDGEVTGQ